LKPLFTLDVELHKVFLDLKTFRVIKKERLINIQKAKRLSTILHISLILLFYLLFLFLYLQNVISEILYLAFLLISLLILSLSIVVFRKARRIKRKITISLAILLLLFCYELPLIGFASQSHIADIYFDPRETVERSGIFIITIGTKTLNNMESKQAVQELLTKEHKDVLTISELTNPMSYKNKNRTLLSWFGQTSPKEKMREDLKEYFGKEEQRITDYFKDDQAIGNSAGLAILLTELMINGAFQNHLPIAVTGAINGKGEVTAVGGIKEKIQIAEKSGFQFMFIPSENSKEAEIFQKELNTNIRIFDVNHVDEAVEQINYLNEKYKKK